MSEPIDNAKKKKKTLCTTPVILGDRYLNILPMAIQSIKVSD